MPVLVTSPGSTLGQAVVRTAVSTGGEVRAFVSGDAPVHVFRQMGVICATGSLLDEGHLETAMEQVHTVVHLGTDLFADDPSRSVDEAATVVSAAVGANVKRIVAVSLPGARVEAADPVRRAAAEAELVLQDAPCPTTIVRASLVDTPELRHRLARAPLEQTALDNAVAPVRPVDIAQLIGWLDDQRDSGRDVARVLAADGPTVVPLRDYLRAVGVTPMSTLGRVVGRLRGGTDVSDVLGGPWTSGPEIPDAWTIAGIAPRSPLES